MRHVQRTILRKVSTYRDTYLHYFFFTTMSSILIFFCIGSHRRRSFASQAACIQHGNRPIASVWAADRSRWTPCREASRRRSRPVVVPLNAASTFPFLGERTQSPLPSITTTLTVTPSHRFGYKDTYIRHANRAAVSVADVGEVSPCDIVLL